MAQGFGCRSRVLHRPWWPASKIAAPERPGRICDEAAVSRDRGALGAGIGLDGPWCCQSGLSKKPLLKPYRPPPLQHLRRQQRELALLDVITAPTTVYEAMMPFDGDGPIDPPVRRIRRTPPRAE